MEKKEPRIIEVYEKLGSEKSNTEGCIIILMGNARSPFRDFESYLGFVVGLDEDEIQLTFRQFNSNFVTYDLLPGIYSIRDISEAVYTVRDYGGTLQIVYDDFTMKTKLIK